VDAQTCKLIVLDKRIESLAKFKQIIGRGTRINEDYQKFYFTIMDFKKATELFADPDFDGDPVQVYEPGPGESPVPPADPLEGERPREPSEPRARYVVGDVPVTVVKERVQYYGPGGKLITESLKDFTRRTVCGEFASLDQFLTFWSTAEQKQVVIDELAERGILFEPLAEEVGRDLDPFDLICHVAFGQPPLTRRERAENVRKRHYFAKHGERARAVLDALLEKYADEGVGNLENTAVLKVQPISRLGTPVELIQAFGGKRQYLAAVKELEQEIYRSA
jgi:type I restriction enzyme R subunit